ncbi:hypothetical protein FIV42_00720 [Persicimonas caeni]|uniref:Uncharacterized protein n=1 Tax=Persicimonas caeni TaxID=2292766 RepID=A0A4Y6PMQ1_PERCE|nr:phage protease [Persicimonas caeni]QDG49307.1 hypothetical protein FIV42_00720 [Persicimonas caeni]QED30528.1 hypothetical protein FRD00_00715 [Persicimonas caeni]
MTKAPEQLNYWIKLADAEGKRTSWVKVLPLGETIDYHGRTIELSADYLTNLVSETQRLNAYFDQKAREGGGEAYRQPIWREHQPKTERDGSVDDVKLTKHGGFNGVWVKLSRTEDAQKAIDAGKIKYVSAGIVPEYTVESGESFGPVIREVSLTADPFLKSIGTIQDTLAVNLSQDALTQLSIQLGADDMEELLKKLEALTKTVDQMGKTVDSVAARLDALEADEDPEPDVDESEETEDVGATDEEPEEEGASDDESASEDESETDDSDAGPGSTTTVLDVDTSAAEAKLSKLANLVDKVNSGFEKLAGHDKTIPRLSKLKTEELGHQGDPEAPAVNLSYEKKIDSLMKKHDCSRLEAIELEMNQ